MEVGLDRGAEGVLVRDTKARSGPVLWVQPEGRGVPSPASPPLIYGGYVEADAAADEAVLAGVDAGGAEDAVAGAEDVGVLGEVGADVVGVGVGVGVGDVDVGEADAWVGVGVGEADEALVLGDADVDWDARADADALAD